MNALYTDPIPPNVDGAFSMIRIALHACPNFLEISWSSVWIAAEWPKPLNSTIAAALAIPSSVLLAFKIANTGDNFSLVNGSFGPTSLHSAQIICVSAGTLNPACSAIHSAGLPTTFGFNLAWATLSE